MFLAMMAFISNNIFSQSFVSTPNGLKDSLNLNNEYLVLKFDGRSANQLYDLTNKFCQKFYVSPKTALQSDIKDEYIKIQTYEKKFIMLVKGIVGEKYYGNIIYSANFTFKDGKVKFEVSEVKMEIWDNDQEVFYRSPGGIYWCIFKKNGTPKGDLYIQYQDYFNKYISNYVYFVNNYKKENDKW